MYIDTEGIILRQTKTTNGRKMVILFTKKFGKIGAGSNIAETGKNKTSLALRPFTIGRYQIQKNGEYYNIFRADVVTSHYKIGENIDKYLNCSFILELTDKVIEEGDKNPRVYNLLLDFFQIIETRNQKYDTLVLAYEVKLLNAIGIMPNVESCVVCGEKNNLNHFSIPDGGMICDECYVKHTENSEESLIFSSNFVIINVVIYFLRNPLEALKNISLQDDVSKKLRKILRMYIDFHLNIGKLKSEHMIF